MNKTNRSLKAILTGLFLTLGLAAFASPAFAQADAGQGDTLMQQDTMRQQDGMDDTGMEEDTGMAEEDTGMAEEDTGMAEEDTGMAEEDTGMADAGMDGEEDDEGCGCSTAGDSPSTLAFLLAGLFFLRLRTRRRKG